MTVIRKRRQSRRLISKMEWLLGRWEDIGQQERWQLRRITAHPEQTVRFFHKPVPHTAHARRHAPDPLRSSPTLLSC